MLKITTLYHANNLTLNVETINIQEDVTLQEFCDRNFIGAESLFLTLNQASEEVAREREKFGIKAPEWTEFDMCDETNNKESK